MPKEPKSKCYEVVIRLKDGVKPEIETRRVMAAYLYAPDLLSVRQLAEKGLKEEEEIGYITERPDKHIY